MRGIAAQMDAVRKQTDALDERRHSADRRDQRPQFLAGDYRRPQCAAAKEDIWITELVALSGGKPIGGAEPRAGGRADAAAGTDSVNPDGASWRRRR